MMSRSPEYFFQDNATPQMEGLEELHNNIMFYLCIVLFAVTWIIAPIIILTLFNYRETSNKIPNKYVNHGTLVEFILIITPALILISIPSFRLLYLIYEGIGSFLQFIKGNHSKNLVVSTHTIIALLVCIIIIWFEWISVQKWQIQEIS